MTATLHGENSTPTINQNWTYAVEATTAGGHPLTGTVLTEFTYNGQVVGKEAPPTDASSVPMKRNPLRAMVRISF